MVRLCKQITLAELAPQRMEISNAAGGEPGRLSVKDGLPGVEVFRGLSDGAELVRPVVPATRVDGRLGDRSDEVAPGRRRP